MAPRAHRLPALGTPTQGGILTADNSAGLGSRLGVHTGLRQMARVHHQGTTEKSVTWFHCY